MKILMLIKKHPAEFMGYYFSFVFLLLATVSSMITPFHEIVSIPLPVAVAVFVCLLSGLIAIYLVSVRSSVKGWRLVAELFIMLAAICSSLSDLFWIFLMIAALIIIGGTIKEKSLSLNSPIIFCWGVLILLCLVSSFFAVESIALSLGAVFGITLYALFFIAVFNQKFLSERGSEFILRIGVLISFSILTTVIFSLWHFKFFPYNINVLIFFFQPKTGNGNSFGLASIYGEWPTHSSAFLSLAFWALVGIRFSVDKISLLRKSILNAGIVFSLIGALATLSRNAFLFLLISFVLAGILFAFRSKNKRWIFACIPLIGFMMAIFLYFSSRFSKWSDLWHQPWNTGTIATRLHQYKFGIVQFLELENPWTGIGLMNFGPLYRKVMNDPHLSSYLHQLFISLLLEIGYAGLLVFLILLFLITKAIYKNVHVYHKSPIFIIVLISWLMTGIFDNWLYFVWSSSLFMVIVALGAKPTDFGLSKRDV